MASTDARDAASVNEEVDLRDIAGAMLGGRWIALLAGVFGAVVFVGLWFALPDKYTSEVVLLPVEEERQGGLASLAAQYGAAGDVAGFNLGGLLGGANKRASMAVEVMKSRQFVADFIRRHDILIELMASDSWSQKGGLTIDPGVYDVDSGAWVGFEGEPSPLEAHEHFVSDVLDVRSNPDTGLFVVSVSHVSPVLAQRWAKWLVDDLNEYIRKNDQAEASKLLEYLQAQIAETELVGMRQVLYQLIEAQLKQLMLAEVREDYVFRVLDPAFRPEETVWPAPWVFALLGLFAGVFVYAIAVTIRLILE